MVNILPSVFVLECNGQTVEGLDRFKSMPESPPPAMILGIPTINTVEKLAELSAENMLTTDRVALEDETMSAARPLLSEVNALVLITTDSQIGTKSDYASPLTEGFIGVGWQRSYIDGFMSFERAKEFCLRMDLVGGALVYCGEHADIPNREECNKVFRIPVTRGTQVDGTIHVYTTMPVLSLPLDISVLTCSRKRIYATTNAQ